MKSLVIQSFPLPCQVAWIKLCLDSVSRWAHQNHYDYRLLGDELFDLLPSTIRKKTAAQAVIGTDIARLIAIQNALRDDYEAVIWCDADFLIFAPDDFHVPTPADLPEGYALGREVWVQPNQTSQGCASKKGLTVHKKVHNAFMLFQQNNVFLDFYLAHAMRLLLKNRGSVPPQFIGPKLLTALHNVIQCPVLEAAAMFSPSVIADILNNTSDGHPTYRQSALRLFANKSCVKPAGANLCHSLAHDRTDSMERLVNKLLTEQVFLPEWFAQGA